MEKIRVAARSFWPRFRLSGSIFAVALQKHYRVELVGEPERADLVFESYWPQTPRDEASIPGKRVFFSGEPHALPVGTHQGVISHHLHLKGNYFRLPLWVLYCDLWPSVQRCVLEVEAGFTSQELTSARLTNPSKFACSIIGVSNHLRLKAPRYLAPFGQVDILGRAMNKPVENKMAVMRDYKFNLCFENTILPGYTTEKALQAKMAGCIPLYWGDPAYRVDFKEKSLINVYEYDFDFQRILDTVDLEEIRHTPLMDKAPLHLLSDLGDFLEGVMRAPMSSVF